MKKRRISIPVLILLLQGMVMPTYAIHLDGLWRNDPLQITLRIESLDDGFKAKRLDQGIWYRYLPEDDHYYTDRHGNYYEIIHEDRLLWREARTGKQIYFNRVRTWGDDRWEQDGDWFHDHGNIPDRDERYGSGTWRDQRYVRHYPNLEGRWYGSDHHTTLDIAFFGNGIKVKTKHGDWEKYYPDRNQDGFRDRFGHRIHIIDPHSIRWTDARGRHPRIYHK